MATHDGRQFGMLHCVSDIGIEKSSASKGHSSDDGRKADQAEQELEMRQGEQREDGEAAGGSAGPDWAAQGRGLQGHE